ncbi:MAG: glycosyltransferase family 2 protein [Candidatus Omnitrophica bacterium]|nr:glycosyltransferase family 2 protein [Candidatus Omnitrophota bacterium]
MISIIIVTHNSQRTLRACLLSVAAQQAEGLEVIIVDNASDDATLTIVTELYPDAILIQNTANKGAAQARNQAIALARGEWVLTLDSDAVLEEGFLRTFLICEKLLAPDVGMVQPNILSADHRRVYSQGIYLSPLRRFFDVNREELFPCHNNKVKKIIGPCAAAAFYRRSMLERLKEATGYFDERFFFLVEDVDLAWRARKAAWQVVFMPELIACHDGDGSCTDLERRQTLCQRNRHLMITKNESFWGRLWVYFISAPYELARTAVKSGRMR